METIILVLDMLMTLDIFCHHESYGMSFYKIRASLKELWKYEYFGGRSTKNELIDNLVNIQRILKFQTDYYSARDFE